MGFLEAPEASVPTEAMVDVETPAGWDAGLRFLGGSVDTWLKRERENTDVRSDWVITKYGFNSWQNVILCILFLQQCVKTN